MTYTRALQLSWPSRALVLAHVIFALSGLTMAQQPRDLSGRIENWPPYGWTANASGQVRLNFEGLAPTTNLVFGSIGNNGRFDLDLVGRDAIPSTAYRSLVDALRLNICSFTPTVTPSNARAAIAVLSVFAANQTQPFGSLRMERRNRLADREEAEISYLIYAERDADVRGSGRCGSPDANLTMSINDQVKRGWNIVTYSGDFRATGSKIEINIRHSPTNRFQLVRSGP